MQQSIDIERDISTFLVDSFLFGNVQALRRDESLMGNVIDSSGVVEFVMFLQEKFAITIDDEEVNQENLDSVSKAAAFVNRKIRSQA